MKAPAVLVFAILVAYVNTLPTQVKDIKEEWEEFKIKYGRSYNTPEEEEQRFAIFKFNVENIEAHNELFRKGESTYTQGINRLADYKKMEMTEFLNKGLLQEPKNSYKGKIFNKTEGFVLPESVDWRNQGIVSEIKDQIGEKCGSCWSFAATGTVEGQYALKTGKLVSLSEQNLVDCTLGKGNNGCAGGSFYVALDYMVQNGIESEEDYPYEAKNDKCRYNSSKIATKVSDYVVVPDKDELALQEAVATVGPIDTSIYFSPQTGFIFYESGIYDGYCSTTNATHGVLLVGYGSENGNDFYLVKNSMGTDWGENGYFRVQRNVGDKCCLAFLGVYPIL